MAQHTRGRRPMSREEALARQERQRLRKEKEQESRELARGPIDLPFCLLVLLLTAIGLVMLLSASFPSAYYETKNNDPMHYFTRQGIFAIMGVAAMFLISKINYQRFRAFAKPLLLGYTGLSDALLQKYITDSAALWEGKADTLPISIVGSVVGTHAGPGAVAVAFFTAEQD